MLVELGRYPSRNKAMAAILAGDVKVDGSVVDKPSFLLNTDSVIETVDKTSSYVSRGGQKLEAAIEKFHIVANGQAVMDGGSSTGGFTECLLRQGARKVIAVDVGYGQLDWKLRQNDRVEVHERVNLRYLKPGDISEKVTLVTLDVSFISILKVIPAIIDCMSAEAEMLALVKPHFEIGKGQVGKGGIVRGKESHRQVLSQVIPKVKELGLIIKGITYSPILGAKGNIEFWLYLGTVGTGLKDSELEDEIEKTITLAHSNLIQNR